MKNFFILLLIISTSQVSNAQELFVEGLELNYRISHFTSSNGPFVNNARITGDTIIENQNCLIFKYEHTTCDLRPIENFILSKNDSVWYYNQDVNEFKLLYDYSLNEGDTLKLEYWTQGFLNDSMFFVTVLSTDSIMINSTMTKRLHVEYHLGENAAGTVGDQDLEAIWISGLGSSINYFHFSGLGLCDNKYNTCLKSIDHPMLGDYDFVCATSLEQTEIDESKIVVFPNPFTDEINFTSKFHLVKRIEIVNSEGKQIITKVLGHEQRKIAIDRLLLPGIYSILFYGEENNLVHIGRIVKMNDW